MSVRLKVHDVIKVGESELVITSLDPSRDQAICFEPATDSTRLISIQDLRRKLADGVATSDAPAPARGLLQDFERESPAYSQFLFNDAVVKRIKHLAHSGRTMRDAIKIARETGVTLLTGEVVPMCSERQAYRLLKLGYDNPIALMPAYSTRGNRIARYGTRMKDITLEVIEDEYAVKKSRITLPFLTKIVTKKARAEGILADSRSVSRKYVRSILLSDWNPDRDYKRLDPRVAKSAKAVAKERIRPGAPLNRVEIDTLHLPFLARDMRGIVDEIFVMLAIDCETSMPLSWLMMRAKPTTDDTFSCLERAIYPKTELLRGLGVDFTVDPFGSIMNLVMDNGQENSKVRLAALTTVGINPQWTEVNSGHRKPFIERLNRSLKEALESLPGCTRFDGKDGERTEEARKDPLLTMEELEHWIVRWLFEWWANHNLDRFITADYEISEQLGFTPALRWQAYERVLSLPIPPVKEDWRRLKFLKSNGSLSAKTGITFETFRFRGPNLPNLIDQYGPDFSVSFHYDPHDYRTIYVPDKDSGIWIRLINSEITADTPAYSFSFAKEQRRTKKAAQVTSPIAEKFSDDLVQKSIEKPSKRQMAATMRKESREHERRKQAQSRADNNPIKEASVVHPNNDTYVTVDAVQKLVKHKKTHRTEK
jgi:putative transposase